MDERARRMRVPDLLEMKRRGEPIAMLTAYDATFARLLDQAGIDVILVGDSLGMVVLGHDDTLGVTMEAMVHHTRAVARGTRRAIVVADMPFLSVHTGLDDAVRGAGRLVQEGGAAAVKIEGGHEVTDAVRRIGEAGIPVMGHLGLLPQSMHRLGGFRPQGRGKGDARRLASDARALEAAGAFAIVLESIPADVARTVTREVSIPTIGIGAGPHCDGQVLVGYDALGLSGDAMPPFVTRYARLDRVVTRAVRRFVSDVRRAAPPGRR